MDRWIVRIPEPRFDKTRSFARCWVVAGLAQAMSFAYDLECPVSVERLTNAED